MRRQLKLQGQLSRSRPDPDGEGPEGRGGPRADASDGDLPEGPSSEELRCCSIAALRAKAREHEAEIHNGRRAPGGDAQTQEAGVRPDH